MSDEPRIYGVRVEVESDLCERGKWVAKWLSYVATGVSPESAVHTLRKRLKATTGIQHINDIRAMHAELTRLRAAVEDVRNFVKCLHDGADNAQSTAMVRNGPADATLMARADAFREAADGITQSLALAREQPE